MKRYLLKSLLYSSLVFGILAAANYYQAGIAYQAPVYPYKFQELFNSTAGSDGPQGILIGNSQVAFGLQPRSLESTGVQYYNFGAGNGNPTYFLTWYDAWLKPYYPQVGYCVIGLGNGFMSNKQLRRPEEDAEYLPKEVFWEMLAREETDKSSLVLNSFPAFKYRKKLFKSLFVGDRPTAQLFDMAAFDRGFTTYNLPHNPYKFRRVPRKYLITDKAKQDLEQLLATLTKDSVQVYLMIPPEYNMRKSQYAPLRHYADSICRAMGLPLFDFNEEYFEPAYADSAYFSDNLHLNAKGSTLMSQTLAEAISARNAHQMAATFHSDQ